MRKITKAISAIAVASALTAAMAVAASAEKAGITFQMNNSWNFRDTIYQSNCLVGDSDYFEETGEEPFLEGDDGTPYYKIDGTATDVEITGDGSYSVSVKGHALESKSGKVGAYNMVKLATNIDPAQYPDLKITIDKVTIGGQELTPSTTEFTADNFPTEPFPADNAFIDQDADSPASPIVFSLINTYGESLVDATMVDPNGDITVDFTVSGMTAATDTPADEGDATEPTEGDNSGKPSTNTGAEGIAVAAGVAVLATGAAIVAKKRK